MKRISLLLICLAVSIYALSQNNYADIVKTKNEILSLKQEVLRREPVRLENNLNKILGLYEGVFAENSVEYAETMMWCAMICERMGDNKQAMKLLKNSCDIFKQYGEGVFDGKDTLDEIFYLDLKSVLYDNAKSDFMAIKYSKRSSELKRSYFGSSSEIYLKSLLDISKLYTKRLNFKKSWEYHNLGYNSYVSLIKEEFCEKSESERINYWYSVKSYIDKTINIAHASANKSSGKSRDSIAGAAYNALLLSKGLLLNTSLSFENYVMESGNIEAILNLDYKKELASHGESQSTLDSLDYVILNVLKDSGQTFSIPHLSITWKDVKNKLAKDDLAIEFYKTTTGDYGAVMIRQDWGAPKIVHLKNYVSYDRKSGMVLSKALNECSFDTITKQDAEKLWKLSKAVWTDEVVKYFPVTDKGRVYFAAEGELLVTGIEYLPFVKPVCENDMVEKYYCLSDLYNMYRLTSTRVLATDNMEYMGTNAAVFGGLNYGMGTEELIADKEKYTKDAREEVLYAFNNEKRDLRNIDEAISELVGTEREADSVAAIINTSNKNNMIAVTYMWDEGTEAAFKALGGKNERLVHIATHGFFYNDTDSLLIQKLKLGDNPLSHSGLIFAGADNKWFGDNIPEGVEDGFLTALEITSLDFRGLDLVVLSACETAKGYVTGDGVFGLQRGFKMAGANSILMSLWKVDDDATCALMTEFYRQWMDGISKHDALELAKDKVRANKKWREPKYWAAFILLDGVE